MKGTILIPIKYLLVYLFSALILTLGVYVYSWCENPYAISGLHGHVELIFQSLYTVMVPASLVALVILILVLQGSRGFPWLMFLALWFSFSGLLFLQISLLRPYHPLPSRISAPVEIPERIHSYSNGAVYIEEAFTKGSPAVMALVSGDLNLTAGRIDAISDEKVSIGTTTLERVPKNPFFHEALQSPPIIRQIFEDFRVISSFFAYTYRSSFHQALLVVAAFGFLISSCWIFGRFTSWPLLNTVYLFLVLRIIVLLSALVLGPKAQEMFQVFVPGLRLTDFVHYIFAGGGMLLVLWDLVFIPFRRFPEKGAGR